MGRRNIWERKYLMELVVMDLITGEFLLWIKGADAPLGNYIEDNPIEYIGVL